MKITSIYIYIYIFRYVIMLLYMLPNAANAIVWITCAPIKTSMMNVYKFFYLEKLFLIKL